MKSRIRLVFWSAVGLVTCGLLPCMSYATVVKKIDMPTVVKHSAVIFHAVVEEVDDDLSTSSRGPFLTRIRFRVLRNWKGHSKPNFELILPGGRAGELRMKIPGMPIFTPSKEVVVFLEPTTGGLVLTGLGQGVYWVENKDGNRLVRNDYDSTSLGLIEFNKLLEKLLLVGE